MLELSKKNFKHREGSHESIFLALYKPCLRSLPSAPFESFISKTVNCVPNNYHPEYNGYYYSVPHNYYNQPTVMQIHSKNIEIFSKDGDRIAIHQRRFYEKRYV